MRVDSFLVINDNNYEVKGEALDAKFKQWDAMSLLSFNFIPYSTSYATTDDSNDDDDDPERKRRRKAALEATKRRLPFTPRLCLQFTKVVDNASPDLFQACCRFLADPSARNTPFEEAILTVRRAGGIAQEYLSIHLVEVFVVEYELASGGEKDQAKETVKFCFERCAIEYEPQSWSGEGGSQTNTRGWDFVTNERV